MFISLSTQRKSEANWIVCLAAGYVESQQQSQKCLNPAHDAS